MDAQILEFKKHLCLLLEPVKQNLFYLKVSLEIRGSVLDTNVNEYKVYIEGQTTPMKDFPRQPYMNNNKNFIGQGKSYEEAKIDLENQVKEKIVEFAETIRVDEQFKNCINKKVKVTRTYHHDAGPKPRLMLTEENVGMVVGHGPGYLWVEFSKNKIPLYHWLFSDERPYFVFEDGSTPWVVAK